MLGDGTELLGVVQDRTAVLEALTEGPASPTALTDRVNVSRSTVNRAIKSLTEAGLATEDDGAIRLTPAGSLALQYYQTVCNDLADLDEATPVLQDIESPDNVSIAAVTGGEVVRSTANVPHRATDQLYQHLRDADQYQAILPTVPESTHIRLLQEHTVAKGRDATLVLPAGCEDTLEREFSSLLSRVTETGNATIMTATVRSYALFLIETNGESAMILATIGPTGGVSGFVYNSHQQAVSWAKEQWDALTDGATDITDTFHHHSAQSDSLSTRGLEQLQQQGFVKLNQDYFFSNRPVRPEVAWQTDMTIADVNAGYAIKRTTTDETPVHQELYTRLQSSDSVIVVGPSGSGKSTLLKQVACEWYRSGVGDVWYRESGHPNSVDNSQNLKQTLQQMESQTLIVAEDVTRQNCVDLLRTVEVCGDTDNIVFLLDARQSEWEAIATDTAALDRPKQLETYAVPSLTRAEISQLIGSVEETTNSRVTLTSQELYNSVASDSRRDPADHGFVSVLHRIVRSLDTESGPTTLHSEMTSLYESITTDGSSLCAGVGINLLNAAGVSVTDRHLDTLNPDGTADSAIATLRSRVLFETEHTEEYRMVHETWSREFLAAFQDASTDPEAHVAHAVSRLLRARFSAETDETSFAHRRSSAMGTTARPDRTDSSVDFVRALISVGMEHPKLAPLFEADGGLCFDLPASVPARARHQLRHLLARALYRGGHYAATSRVVDRLTADVTDQELSIEITLLQRKLATRQGKYERALELAQNARAAADNCGVTRLEARSMRAIGHVKREQGNRQAAEDWLHRSSEILGPSSSPQYQAKVAEELGQLAHARGEFESAAQWFDEQVELASRGNAQRLEAAGIHNCAGVSIHTGALDEAYELLQRSLTLRREIGDRAGVADSLGNLGVVEYRRGNYEQAREYHNQSLNIKDKIGDTEGKTTTLINLGELATACGEIQAAADHLRDGLRLAQEVGNAKRRLAAIVNLARLAVRQGDYDDAERYGSRGVTLAQEYDDTRREAKCLMSLAAVQLARGDVDAADKRATTALNLSQSVAAAPAVARARVICGKVAAERGDCATARGHYQRGLAVLRNEGDPRVTCELLCGLGALARVTDEMHKACRYLAAADAVVTGQQPAQQGAIYLEQARVALARSRVETAVEDVETAQHLFEQHGLTPSLGEAYALEAAVVATQGDPAGARSRFETATELLADTGERLSLLTEITRTARMANEWDDKTWFHSLCERGQQLALEVTPQTLSAVDEYRSLCQSAVD